LQALELSGQRGIVQAGWGGLATEHLPADIYPLESAPFDWLFPRLAAAVHHGGVGTTAEALRAGIPSIIVPFIADQAFWGWQAEQVGAGTAPIPYYRLTAQNLAQAIRQAVEDESLRLSCAALGAGLKGEDGAATAAQILETYLGNYVMRIEHEHWIVCR
jgi:UDP:flavonoid glycosyltransferase YjiC (YdhE family)